MIINHNIQALNTYRQFGAANASQSKSMEKLSSGLRINRAGDDAAGLAISEKMRAQVRGLDQAATNAQDGISLIQTAEGALTETHSILQRMRELATKAANDTYTAEDRGEIQKEMNQLTSEINRIGNTTEFNTKKLLNGDLTIKGTNSSTTTPEVIGKEIYAAEGEYKIGTSPTTWTDGKIGGSFDVKVSGTTDSGVDWDAAITEVQKASPAAGAKAEITITQTAEGVFELNATVATKTAETTKVVNKALTFDGTNYSFNSQGIELSFTAEDVKNWEVGKTVTIDFSDAGTERTIDVGAEITALTDAAAGSDKKAVVSDFKVAANSTTENLAKVSANYVSASKTLTISLQDKDGNVIQSYEHVEVAADKVINFDNNEGLTFTFKAGDKNSSFEVALKTYEKDITQDKTTTTTQKDDSLRLQIGANTGQSFSAEIGDMRASALGLSKSAAASQAITIDGKSYTAKFTTADVTNGTDNVKSEYALDVSTHENATAAIHVVNDAILKVSAQRSQLGAYQNRLEHTINNLGAASENLTAAESRIRDVDMAKEIMAQTKFSILSQASQAMLAQANQNPQNVLQLLR